MSVRPHIRNIRTAGGRATVVCALTLLATFELAPAGLAAGHTVQARNYEFATPDGGSSLTLTVGDTVTWVASGDPHTVTSGSPGSLDHQFVDHSASVGFLSPGASFTTTFPIPGVFRYFCEVHPEQMTGVVTVLAASSTPRPTIAPAPRPTAASTSAPTPPPTVTLSPAPTPASVTTSPPSGTGTPPAAPVTPSSGSIASTSPSPAAGSAKSDGGGSDGASLPTAVLIAGVVVLGGILVVIRRGRGRPV